MKAFQTYWTLPIKDNELRQELIMFAILSALKWKELNGPIYLYTDERGMAEIDELGITDIWDNINVSCLSNIKNINPNTFWAASKLYAMNHCTAPCISLDMDMIIWKDIKPYLNCDICAAHWDDSLSHPFYLKFNELIFPEGYKWNSKLNMNCYALNTAFVYFKDQDFKDFYTSESINFMRNNHAVDSKGKLMVFAEQHMLAMCAKAQNKKVHTLLEGIYLTPSFNNRTDLATHLWGIKDTLKQPSEKVKFTLAIIRKLIESFPDKERYLQKFDFYRQYYGR